MTSTRSRARSCELIAMVVMVVGMLTELVPTADAASPPCRVTNLMTQQFYGGTGSNLQTAIDQAVSGTRLRVRGLCVGNYTIGKDLALIGGPTAAFPTPTLDGNASGTVLFVSTGSVVLTDLRITNGNAGFGAGIINRAPGTVRLKGTSSVSGNVAAAGAGITNNGTLIMNGGSSVSGNTAGSNSGGIWSNGTVIMNGSSSVSGNRGNDEEAGGIYSDGTLIMNDSASVSRNTATRIGGGIYSDYDGTITMNDASSVRGNRTLIHSSFGGGIFTRGTLILRDSSSVLGNRARSGRGGGISNGGGTVDLYGSSSVSGNRAGHGGGIYNDLGTVTVNGTSSVRGNTAVFDGGGIFTLEGGALIMTGSSSVTGNDAGLYGGGIQNDGIFLACDTWTGAITPNTPDDPPTPTPITC